MSDGLPKRRSVRLPAFDYASATGYFVTICIHNRATLLGGIAEGEMALSADGRIAETAWLEIPEHFPHVTLDAFVVMPNHVHGVLILSDARRAGAACRAPTSTLPRAFGPPDRRSLSTVIRSFKSAATRENNRRRRSPGAAVWQRSFHEHVIRHESDLLAIRQCVRDNPACWHQDEENPDGRGSAAALP